MSSALFDPRVLGAPPAGLRRERIAASPRFRDGRFHNTAPLATPMGDQPLSKRLSIVGEFFLGKGRRSPTAAFPVESPLEAWQRPAETGLRATWLGHSPSNATMAFPLPSWPVTTRRIGCDTHPPLVLTYRRG